MAPDSDDTPSLSTSRIAQMALPKYSPSTSGGSDEGSLNDDSSDRSFDNGALLEVSPEPEGDAEEDTTENMDSRAYQLEMFQRSLKENVIVAVSVAHGCIFSSLANMI